MKSSFKKLLENYEHLKKMPADGFQIGGKPALTGIDGSLIGRYVIITVRDPLCAYENDPATEIADKLENAILAGRSGMFTTYSGYFERAYISVVSGGIGSPEAELILREFMQFSQADTFVRVGGSGGWNENVHVGDVVISSGAVRDEGMTQAYISPTYPAVANHELVLAFAQAATDLGVSFHIGLTRSTDSEFVGSGRPSVDGYLQPEHAEILDYYDRAGVLNGDRETSAVITLSALFGKRGGAVCSVADNVISGEPFRAGAGHEKAIQVALKGLSTLHQ